MRVQETLALNLEGDDDNMPSPQPVAHSSSYQPIPQMITLEDVTSAPDIPCVQPPTVQETGEITLTCKDYMPVFNNCTIGTIIINLQK